jgi:hypothetical protein
MWLRMQCMQKQIQTVARAFVITFLVGAYLSTWSAALIHSLVVPALGSGPASVSTSHQPSKEKPQVSFTQRRHMPLVKSISLVAPPPSTVEYPRVLPWFGGIADLCGTSLSSDPSLSPHSGRAPPAC